MIKHSLDAICKQANSREIEGAPGRICAENGGACYVNAYEVNRYCGGPEEGGWWYDAGYVLGSIQVRTKADALKAYVGLSAIFDLQYDNNYGRYSAVNESDLSIYIEDEPAKEWPEVTPRYE